MSGRQPNAHGTLAERIVAFIIRGEKPRWKGADVVGKGAYVEVKATRGDRALVSLDQLRRFVRARQADLEGKEVRRHYAFVFLGDSRSDVYFVDARKLLEAVDELSKHRSSWLLKKREQALLRASSHPSQSRLLDEEPLHIQANAVHVPRHVVEKIAHEHHVVHHKHII